MSSRARLRLAAQFLSLLIVAAVFAAGCGGDDDGGAESTGVMQSGETTATEGRGAGDATAPSGKVAAVTADLTVTLGAIGSKSGGGIPVPARATCTRSIPATCRAELTCPAAEGAPDVDLELCRWIAETPVSVFTDEPAQSGQVCTQIYGGPETATIKGTRDGQPISATYSRQNGCAIARWDLAAPIWTGTVPPAGTGAPQSIDGDGRGGMTPSPDAPVGSPPAGTTEPEIITDPIR